MSAVPDTPCYISPEPDVRLQVEDNPSKYPSLPFAGGDTGGSYEQAVYTVHGSVCLSYKQKNNNNNLFGRRGRI